MAGALRSTVITRFFATTTPSDFRHRSLIGYSFPIRPWGATPATTDLSGSSTVLLIRAVRIHPGELGDCTCLCLHHPCWLRHIWKVGHSHFNYGADLGSRFRITARIIRLPRLRRVGYPITAPGQLHVHRQLHDRIFHSTRTVRLFLTLHTGKGAQLQPRRSRTDII